MKNLYLIPTDKPSRLQLQMNGNFHIENGKSIALRSYQNIYITSDSEIKEGDWVLFVKYNTLHKAVHDNHFELNNGDCKKINLTTDQDLIKNGVQAIDDEFLEWFINNPTCEEVKVESQMVIDYSFPRSIFYRYKIIIPKELPNRACTQDVIDAAQKEVSKDVRLPKVVREGMFNSKQETLEEILPKNSNGKYSRNEIEKAFELGAKYQAERMYSEEEVYNILVEHTIELLVQKQPCTLDEFFEQYKKIK